MKLRKSQSIISYSFLAHLAQSAKVRYWGGPVPVVRRRVSCVLRRQQLHKHLLLRNNWVESYETSPEASLGGGPNDTERNFDSIIILVSMATEREKLKKNI